MTPPTKNGLNELLLSWKRGKDPERLSSKQDLWRLLGITKGGLGQDTPMTGCNSRAGAAFLMSLPPNHFNNNLFLPGVLRFALSAARDRSQSSLPYLMLSWVLWRRGPDLPPQAVLPYLVTESVIFAAVQDWASLWFGRLQPFPFPFELGSS